MLIKLKRIAPVRCSAWFGVKRFIISKLSGLLWLWSAVTADRVTALKL